MNEHTATLLQSLATKLGTTTEYLWTILLKQAPVYASIVIAQYVVTVAVLVAAFAGRRYIERFLRGWFEQEEVTAFIFCVIAGLCTVVWLLACAFEFGNVVTAYINPEYWALNKVLATVKSAK